VRGAQADRGAKIVVRLRIARRHTDAGLGELDRSRHVLPEFRVEVRRRLAQLDLRPAEGSEIVIDGDRAAREQHVQPQDGRERAMRRRIRWVLGHGLPETRQGLFVIEVVGEIEGFAAHRRRIGGKTRAGDD
jgi:hypothetical protein